MKVIPAHLSGLGCSVYWLGWCLRIHHTPCIALCKRYRLWSVRLVNSAP